MQVSTHADLRVQGAPRPSRRMPPSDSTMRMTLLRGFELRCGGEHVSLPFGTQRVLAFLALQECAVHRTYAAGTLWPDTMEERANASLRSALWRLRRSGYPLVRTSNTEIRLAPEVHVDLRDAVSFARRLLDRSRDVPETELDASALAGELLPDFYDEFVVLERERFHQLRLHALEALSERLSATGRFGQAIDVGMAAIAGEPLRESAHRTLIKVFLAEGNRADALRQYAVYRSLVRRELDAEPSPRMEELICGLRR